MCCAMKTSEIKQKHIFYPLTIFIARNEQEKFLFHIQKDTYKVGNNTRKWRE